jgi:hypothetical protein
MPGDLSVEETLELDDTDPDNSRLYAGMVTVGWAGLAVGFLVAIGLAFPVGSLLGEQAGDSVATVFLAAEFFCLAGCANALWHMLWHVPQARRHLHDQGVTSEPFRRSMRRSLPGNTSLIFQTAVALLVLVL